MPVTIEPLDAASGEATALFAGYVAELSGIFGKNPTTAVPTTAADFTPPRGQLLVVRDEAGTPVGCGAVRLLDAQQSDAQQSDPTTAEVKRMWLHASMRGRGAGRLLLAALEQSARDLGATRGVLDTHGALTAALALYRSAGWQAVPSYNANPEATHWFAKPLD